MSKKRQSLHPNDPLLHPDHPRPRTRREFLRQGLITGGAVVTGSSLLNLFLSPEAQAIDSNLLYPTNDIGANCISGAGARIPFICFDLAGGANFASSNVLVGQQGGQTARMDAAAYRMHGLPADRIADGTAFTNSELGLLFHSESALLAGILSKLAVAGRANVNGAVIPARSENDTGNNPHNPLYAIARTGALGQAATLIGSVNSDSGGNSLAPSAMPFSIDPALRPVKVDRPTDVTGLVGTGDTGGVSSIISLQDAVRVMESAARITNSKLPNIDTLLGGATDTQIKQLIRCGYTKSAYLAEQFGDINAVDPGRDADIRGATGIFSEAEWNGTDSGEFRKAASVMKMVINRMSGAGCVTMGGYDYHTGDRIAGERRDLRAGKCIGACLEYARRKNMPLMIYVFSDGSVFSNGTMDNTTLTDNGTGTTITVPAGKGVWTGDSSTTASSFFLVYNPTGRPQLISPARQQLGWFRANGGVETASSPGANNVNQLVEMVVLNYLALHNTNGINTFASTFPGHHLGASYDQWAAFQPIV